MSLTTRSLSRSALLATSTIGNSDLVEEGEGRGEKRARKEKERRGEKEKGEDKGQW